VTVSGGGEPGQIHYRRPVEADHARLIGVVDEWWGGRPLHHLLHRLWFQEALGFRLDDRPGTLRLEGVTAYPDYEGDGRPIAVMRLSLDG
jgi:hypothetical protein